MIQDRSKVGLVRKFAAIVLASAFVVSVAACSDLPAQVQGCTPTYTSGSASESISATGAIGSQPKVHVPTPTVTKRVEVSTLKSGTGLLLGKDDYAEVSSSLYNGKTGKLLVATNGTGVYTKKDAIQIPVAGKSTLLAPTVTKSLACARVGSRIVTVLSAPQVYGSKAAAAQAAEQGGFSANQTMVLVTDISAGYRGRATGALQPLQPGFPSVVTSGNGTPGLTLDLQEPPKSAINEVVRGGGGVKVKDGQKVLLQVQAIAWTTPAPTTTFDSTWKTLSPRFYTLTPLTKNAAGYSLDASSVEALVGQRVGSQVMVVVPPKDGYPDGKQPTGYPTGETLIFVYDILGIY